MNRISNSLRLVIFSPEQRRTSETFIRAHVEQLPFEVFPRYGIQTDLTDSTGKKIWQWGWWFREAARRLAPELNNSGSAFFLARHLKTIKADAVLAEYGTTGSWLAPACAKAGVPLFVHFHGYDAWNRDHLKIQHPSYQKMFEIAAGVVAVSEPMRRQLITLGAEPARLHLNPYGVDPEKFNSARPGEQPPHFLAVGRFVEKKAPYLTILAFSRVLASVPNATLTMAGDGPLTGPCKRLAAALGISKSVTFTGIQTHDRICQLMQSARTFVQHSLVAENGDCEGTPVAVLEAQMSGLPVVSTRHAGIPEVVIEGETGFLVDEGDTRGMAAAMLKLANSSKLACDLGRAARNHAITNFAIKRHLEALSQMITDEIKKQIAADRK
jgi:colanic acid/amylovoran biosynthesis glycosyltransferase